MAISLRSDFDAASVRVEARASRDPDQVRRLLALASIYDGKSRSEAARTGDVTLQVVRDWVLRFNAQGPSGLIDRKAPGNKPLLNPEQRAALAEVVKAGPEPAIDGVVRWRLADLAQWVWETFSISISRQTLGSELRALGFRKLSARPRHHEQAEGAIEDFKKRSRRHWLQSPRQKLSISPRSKSGSATRPG